MSPELVILLLLFGVPLIAVVQCVRSDLPKDKKTAWMVAMFCVLPVAYIYLILHAKTPARRAAIAAACACLLVAGGYLFYTASHGGYSQESVDE